MAIEPIEIQGNRVHGLSFLSSQNSRLAFSLSATSQRESSGMGQDQGNN